MNLSNLDKYMREAMKRMCRRFGVNLIFMDEVEKRE